MPRAEYRLDLAKASVLVFAQDHFEGRSYVAALEQATVPVECVTTASALRSRLNRADLPRPALVMVLPSQQTSMGPSDLVSVALGLTPGMSGDVGPTEAALPLEHALNDYCALRSLSPRQRQVLELYLI